MFLFALFVCFSLLLWVYVAAVLRIAIGMFLCIFGVLIVIGGVLTAFVGFHFAQTILALWSSRGPSLVRLFA
jgi:hypothetical protein